MKYLSTFEVAEKWGISPRRVGILCNNDRIPGAQRAGSRWIIPEDAEKPTDARIKSGKWMIPLQEDMPHKTRCLLPLALCCWDRTKLPKQYRQPEPLMP